jgi:RNA polymerase sigma factor (sigma-70 family)
MEVSALKYSGGIGLHGRSPLLRLQSDERLVALARRGNSAAFEVLVNRYSSRLLAFCRHLLVSREDAEDVLQEVLAAAFNAMLADDRPINVRPWLYRIARNRCLNHLRRAQAVGVDSMDIHFSDHGATTADKAHEREEFRLLVGDIHELPETQKTALVLREMDALSYEQIAEAMETTVPSVKSLLVRARVSLAEAAEARLLSCDEVRIELGEVAEGLRRKPSPLVRRHLRACKRCASFRFQLKETNKALAALMPIGPLVVLKKLVFGHFGHGAGHGAAGSSAAGSTTAGASTTAAGTTAAGTTAAGSTAASVAAGTGSTILAGSSASGFVSAGVGAIATKAAAGLAAAAIVTAGAVEVDRSSSTRTRVASSGASSQAVNRSSGSSHHTPPSPAKHHAATKTKKPAAKAVVKTSKKPAATLVAAVTPSTTTTTTTRATTTTSTTPPAPASPPQTTSTPAAPGRTQTQTDPTVLPSPPTTTLSDQPSPPTTAAASPPPTTTVAVTPTTPSTPTTPTTPPDGGDGGGTSTTGP